MSQHQCLYKQYTELLQKSKQPSPSQSKFNELSSKIIMCQQQIQEYKIIKENQNQKIKKFQFQKSNLTKQLNIQKQKNSQINSQIKILQNSIEESNYRIQEMRMKIQQLQTDNTKLLSQFQKHSKQYYVQQQLKQIIQKQCCQLTEIYCQLKQSYKIQQNQKIFIQQLVNQKQEMQLQSKEFKNIIKELKEQLQKKTETSQQQKDKTYFLEKTRIEAQQNKQLIQAYKYQLKQMSQQNYLLKQEIENKTNQINWLMEQKIFYMKQKTQIQEYLDNIQRERNQFNFQITQLKKQKKELIQQLQKISQNKIESLTILRQCQKNLKKMQEYKVERQKLIEDNIQLSYAYKKIENQFQMLQKMNNSQKLQIIKLQQQLKMLKERVLKCHQQKLQMDIQKRTLEACLNTYKTSYKQNRRKLFNY